MYPERWTIVALAVNYKDIISFVVNGSTTEVFPGQFLPGTQPASCTPTGETGLYDCPYVVNRPVNGPGGTNKGIELQVSRPIWGGFGIPRSEERRVGKGCGSKRRYRCSTFP